MIELRHEVNGETVAVNVVETPEDLEGSATSSALT